MKTGDMLELVREPDNEHDEFAVALHFNNQKIGFLPMEENEIISRLIDSGVIELMAEITHLEPQAAAWENVCVVVYILKQTYMPLAAYAQYLTILNTPFYSTLKNNNNTVTRVFYNDTEIADGNSFYEALVDNSQTNEVYTLIHEGFKTPDAMETAVKEARLVINKEKIPADLKADKVLRAIDDALIEIDEAFDEKGYVVANINRVAELSPRLEKFVEVTDKLGRNFFEIVFKNK